MLAFSPDQLTALADERRRRFVHELGRRARARHPEVCAPIPRETLEAAMDAEVTRAHGMGLRDRADIERLSDIAAALGFGDWAAAPWAARAVEAHDLKPRERLDKLARAAVFAVRSRG